MAGAFADIDHSGGSSRSTQLVQLACCRLDRERVTGRGENNGAGERGERQQRDEAGPAALRVSSSVVTRPHPDRVSSDGRGLKLCPSSLGCEWFQGKEKEKGKERAGQREREKNRGGGQ